MAASIPFSGGQQGQQGQHALSHQGTGEAHGRQRIDLQQRKGRWRSRSLPDRLRLLRCNGTAFRRVQCHCTGRLLRRLQLQLAVQATNRLAPRARANSTVACARHRTGGHQHLPSWSCPSRRGCLHACTVVGGSALPHRSRNRGAELAGCHALPALGVRATHEQKYAAHARVLPPTPKPALPTLTPLPPSPTHPSAGPGPRSCARQRCRRC